MAKQNKNQQWAGYTLVWQGYASDAFEAYEVWAKLGKDNIKFRDEDPGVSIHIPNEFINWQHFRDTGEYVPSSEKVKRGRKMQEAIERCAEADRGVLIEAYKGVTPGNLNEELGG